MANYVLTDTGVDVSSAVSGIFDLGASALNMVTSNPLLLTFACAGLVFIGIAVVKKFMR